MEMSAPTSPGRTSRGQVELVLSGPAIAVAEGESQSMALWLHQRLVRELRHGPVRTMTDLLLQVRECQRLAWRGDLEALNEELERLDLVLRRAIGDFRHLVRGLQTSASDGEG
jgi:hypothetical protein